MALDSISALKQINDVARTGAPSVGWMLSSDMTTPLGGAGGLSQKDVLDVLSTATSCADGGFATVNGRLPFQLSPMGGQSWVVCGNTWFAGSRSHQSLRILVACDPVDRGIMIYGIAD